ncbi:type IV secretory system conjugative DNA transfer family protein [Thomasclavelia spiroformis]|uniref:type IV secretory system conjugative DNA transfer family protein n=1 Tax=Thomasclavelia spiroformis TaxID=29348 RepID=UPI00241E945B|nr:type IV secretion system DNA-binding domain-containing protein [Thomasclavelia spiroformis]
MWSKYSNDDIWKYQKEISNTKMKKQVDVINDKSTFLGLYGKKKIFINNDVKHIFICGTTGSGKTVTLSNFIESVFKYDYPSLIVDGKGDINKGSILDYINKFKKIYPNKKVYVIDLNNPETCDRYNPFYQKKPTVIKDMLISMTDWSEEHYKVNASRYIQKVVYLMQENNIEITLESVIKHLSLFSFTDLSLRLQKEKIISKEEHLENVKNAENMIKIVEGAMARFSLLVESDIGAIFKTSKNSIDIPSALNENAIILFILNPLIYPETSPLFGRLITIDAKQGVSSLFHKKFERTFYIFDEISIYASNELLLLVNLSRSANITSILATQSLSDLENVSESFRKQVIESCNNYIVMRQNEPTNAEIWANTIGTRKSPEVTYQIKNNHQTTDTTGLGSFKITRVYLYHPDIIKSLKMGEAIYISKDNNIHYKVKINKPNL